MSIPNDPEEINTIPEETLKFDEKGHIQGSSPFKKHFLPLLFILVAVLSFGIGKLSATKSNPGVNIKYDPSLSSYQDNVSVKGKDNSANVVSSPVVKSPSNTGDTNSSGGVFASSKGKRYYYPGCKSTIVEKNKITFANKEMAESAGYTLASGCTQR